MTEQRIEREHRVTPLELFFDLVFVFALTEVTTFLSEDPTWHGLVRAVLLLGALWWAWAGYAWLTNTLDAEADPAVAALLVAMGAMFVAALAVPTAFGRHAVLFGAAFLVVQLMHITLYALAARDDPELLNAIGRLARSAVPAALLIFVAGFTPSGWRPYLWFVALIVGFGGALVGGLGGWRLEPGHLVERHGLIIIIALGESLIAVGVGARATSLGAEVVIAALLGLAVAASFWIAYFDFFTIRIQQLLAERQGVDRVKLAREIELPGEPGPRRRAGPPGRRSGPAGRTSHRRTPARRPPRASARTPPAAPTGRPGDAGARAAGTG